MNIYIICLTIFFIYAVCYIGYRIVKRHNVDHFENQYEFLTPKDAYKIIEDSGYFGKFNTANLRARLCANITNCKLKYLKELMRVDPMEEDAIKWLVNLILEKLKEKGVSVALFNMSLKFAKFSSNLEGNMPHTHKDVIYLPASYYADVWKLYQQTNNKTDDKDYIIKKYGGTLIHELCHVFQRKYESYFNKLYKNRWHFTTFDVNTLTKCENILQLNRLNPDGSDVNWLWVNPYSTKYKQKQEYYWLLAVFRDNHPKFLTDTNNSVYILNKNTDRNYTVKSIDVISENEPLRSYFGSISNNYHPNEISAEYMSIYFLEKMDIEPDVRLSAANTGYHEFVSFMNNMLWM